MSIFFTVCRKYDMFMLLIISVLLFWHENSYTFCEEM